MSSADPAPGPKSAWPNPGPDSAGPAPGPESAAAAQARAESQLAALDEVAREGLDLIQALHDQVTQASTDTATLPDARTWQAVTSAYCRISRAIRLTLVLQDRLMRADPVRPSQVSALRSAVRSAAAAALVPPPVNSVPDSASEPAPTPARDTASSDARMPDAGARAARKARARGIVGQVIDRLARDAEESQRLDREAGERLQDLENFDDFLERPFSEILAYICDQLGLKPDWDHIADEPWARREAAQGAGFPPKRWWTGERSGGERSLGGPRGPVPPTMDHRGRTRRAPDQSDAPVHPGWPDSIQPGQARAPPGRALSAGGERPPAPA